MSIILELKEIKPCENCKNKTIKKFCDYCEEIQEGEYFKCRGCGEKILEDYCSIKDQGLCYWCSGDLK